MNLKANTIYLPETGSTNVYAAGLLKNSRPQQPCVIVAAAQTQGKGLDNNQWESEAGKNLTFSIILYPEFYADQQFLLNKAVALGIKEYLAAEFPNQSVTIKWPNDIYIGDSKVCGILIQNSLSGRKFDNVIIGIGLNVNQEVFISNAPNPVSMKMLSGINYNLDLLLDTLLKSIFQYYSLVTRETARLLEQQYLNSLYRYMQWHKYSVTDEIITARITGVTTYGRLILESEDNELSDYDIKEVKFIIKNPAFKPNN